MQTQWVDLTTAGDGGDGNWSMIGLLFFASGFVFYAYVFLRYRNTDKRFEHESRTRSVRANVQQRDERVRKLKGLSNAKMKGANNYAVGGAQSAIASLIANAGQGSTKAMLDQLRGSQPEK